MHGWTGGPQFIQNALDLGLHISFGPSVLNHQRKKIRESAKQVPLDRLCIETDAPDHPIGTASYGQPADLVLIAQELATLRGEDVNLLWDTCGMNARTLWNAHNV